MEYIEYIKPELLILIPALIGLGKIFKETEKIKDNYIPLVLSSISILLTCLYILGTEGITAVSVFTAIVQGLICASGAVYGNQLYKQVTKE